MTTRQRFKGQPSGPQSVGVIASMADLRIATQMRHPPDLFELRLDHLWPNLTLAEKWFQKMRGRSELIITARHPREGGANNLSLRERRELLLRFLSLANFVDIELRSVEPMAPVIKSARRSSVHLVLSFHDFESTPNQRSLQAKAQVARKSGADIFKVATRAGSKAELARLMDFFLNCDTDIPISAMGMGKFGPESRKRLAALGSILNYGSIGSSRVAGQPSITEIKKWIVAPSRR